MMRRFISLFSGNMHYAEPSAPVRGSDWSTRAAPDMLQYRANSVEGTGARVGTYDRTTPYAFNTVQQQVVFDVNGRGVQSRSPAMAGHLLDPATLAKRLGIG